MYLIWYSMPRIIWSAPRSQIFDLPLLLHRLPFPCFLPPTYTLIVSPVALISTPSHKLSTPSHHSSTLELPNSASSESSVSISSYIGLTLVRWSIEVVLAEFFSEETKIMIMKSPFSRPSTIPSRSPMRYMPPTSPMRHTFSDSHLEENVEIAEALINKWDLAASGQSKVGSLFRDNWYEANMFLSCVKNLQAAMRCCIKHDNSDPYMLVRAQNLMQTAMKWLEKELYDILSANKNYLDPESVSSRCSQASTGMSSVLDGKDESEEEEFTFVHRHLCG